MIYQHLLLTHVDFSLGGVQRKLEALANNLRQVNYYFV